jgi:hypothetical protein
MLLSAIYWADNVLLSVFKGDAMTLAHLAASFDLKTSQAWSEPPIAS